MIRKCMLVLMALTCIGAGRLETEEAQAAPATQPVAQAKPYLLHLPGVGGKRSIDLNLINGLRFGGMNATYEIYDWCGQEIGMAALWSTQRHQREAAIVAGMIERLFRENPQRPIILTGHSGGAGILTWALELLPDDVQVAQVLMLAPALSPQYDLSRALRRVSGQVHVFSSIHDSLVLGAGTRMMGTIDGIKCDAAGLNGFDLPPTADAEQYRKLIACSYRPAWLRYDNAGEHIGAMSHRFARYILAPLLLTGKLPEDREQE